jgi:hypothetical protein
MFGAPVAGGVVQTGNSGPENGDNPSVAVAPASATLTWLPVSSTSSAELASAAPADTRSFCDRVNVVMPFSQKLEDENPPNLKSNGQHAKENLCSIECEF